MTEQAQVPARKKGNAGVKAILVLVALLVATGACFILGAVRQSLGASVPAGMF
ncbi:MULTISPECIES: hypothetical protein [unclassified Paenarthrobacter]|uniref:hypothetical protein n=1 Tax=unclassified Paenarthrobacter TaxID=2634190 RepID=UPI001F3D6FF3|nr:hypothetical protein [Paenarthrobacter sp. AR 02]MCF3139995.1 hypothetical protein [Paenarthrobacter sp. AR 02]